MVQLLTSKKKKKKKKKELAMVRIAVSVERIGNEWVMLELQVIKDAIEYHAAFQPLQLLSPHPPLPPFFSDFFYTTLPFHQLYSSDTSASASANWCLMCLLLWLCDSSACTGTYVYAGLHILTLYNRGRWRRLTRGQDLMAGVLVHCITTSLQEHPS